MPSDAAKALLDISVGDTVVYAAHGVGRVVAREQKRVDGTKRDWLIKRVGELWPALKT